MVSELTKANPHPTPSSGHVQQQQQRGRGLKLRAAFSGEGLLRLTQEKGEHGWENGP